MTALAPGVLGGEDGPAIEALRAHHFLCLATYQGRGYSRDFVANMNEVWACARSGAIGQVRATAVADGICRACPHLASRGDPAGCRFHPSTAGRDQRMIAAMGWELDQEVSFAVTMEAVHARHEDLLARVCEGCDWIGICSRQHFTLRDPAFRLPVEPGAPPEASSGGGTSGSGHQRPLPAPEGLEAPGP